MSLRVTSCALVLIALIHLLFYSVAICDAQSNLKTNSSVTIQSVDIVSEVPSKNDSTFDLIAKSTNTPSVAVDQDAVLINVTDTSRFENKETEEQEDDGEDDVPEKQESRTLSKQQSNGDANDEMNQKRKSKGDSPATPHHPHRPPPLGDVCSLTDFCPADPEMNNPKSPKANGGTKVSDKLVALRPFDLHEAYHANKHLAILDRHLLELQKTCPHLVAPHLLHTQNPDVLFLAPASGCNPTQVIRLVQLMRVVYDKFAACDACYEFSFKPLLCGFASQMVIVSSNLPITRPYPLPFVASPNTFYADDAWQSGNEVYIHK